MSAQVKIAKHKSEFVIRDKNFDETICNFTQVMSVSCEHAVLSDGYRVALTRLNHRRHNLNGMISIGMIIKQDRMPQFYQLQSKCLQLSILKM